MCKQLRQPAASNFGINSLILLPFFAGIGYKKRRRTSFQVHAVLVVNTPTPCCYIGT